MAQLHHAGVNGTSRPDNPTYGRAPSRFSDIPPAIDVPVSGGDFEEAVEINLEELLDDPTELCTLLENENVAKSYWITIALAYAKQHKVDHAIEMLLRALSSSQSGQVSEKLSLLSCLCWLYLCKSRGAPRVRPGESASRPLRIF